MHCFGQISTGFPELRPTCGRELSALLSGGFLRIPAEPGPFRRLHRSNLIPFARFRNTLFLRFRNTLSLGFGHSRESGDPDCCWKSGEESSCWVSDMRIQPKRRSVFVRSCVLKRSVKPGELFDSARQHGRRCIQGDRFDGHNGGCIKTIKS
jgi:hypothetical protein